MPSVDLHYFDGRFLETFTFEGKHEKSYYLRHAPGGSCIQFADAGSHLKLEPIERFAHYCQWMDRTGLVLDDREFPLDKLAVNDGHWGYCRQWQFENTTVWRRPRSKNPCLVLTEPKLQSTRAYFTWLDLWSELQDETGLRYMAYLPSKRSLFDKDTLMVFWYRPDFDFAEKIYLGDVHVLESSAA